jgi:hypothetical protein
MNDLPNYQPDSNLERRRAANPPPTGITVDKPIGKPAKMSMRVGRVTTRQRARKIDPRKVKFY